MLSLSRFEFQGPAQRDDELSHRGRVPCQRAARLRLAKRRSRDQRLVAEKVAASRGPEVDHAFFELRVLIIASPYSHASEHRASLFVCRIVLLSLFWPGTKARNTERVFIDRSYYCKSYSTALPYYSLPGNDVGFFHR